MIYLPAWTRRVFLFVKWKISSFICITYNQWKHIKHWLTIVILILKYLFHLCSPPTVETIKHEFPLFLHNTRLRWVMSNECHIIRSVIIEKKNKNCLFSKHECPCSKRIMMISQVGNIYGDFLFLYQHNPS